MPTNKISVMANQGLLAQGTSILWKDMLSLEDGLINRASWINPTKQQTILLLDAHSLDNPIHRDAFNQRLINVATAQYVDYTTRAQKPKTVTIDELNLILAGVGAADNIRSHNVMSENVKKRSYIRFCKQFFTWAEDAKKIDRVYFVRSERTEAVDLLGFSIDKQLFIVNKRLMDAIGERFSSQGSKRAWIQISNLLVKHKISKNKIDTSTITIGIDPEFSIYRKDKNENAVYRSMVRADRILGCRSTGLDVGCDGNPYIGELRPKESTRPAELADRVESLFHKLEGKLRKLNEELFIETGGGCLHSIGGHIHFGHELFKTSNTEELLRDLAIMLDDFLYWPIKKNMVAGTREWRAIKYGLCRPDELPGDPEQMKEEIKACSPNGRFANYDFPSQVRSKPWGFEYRSLPSFISDKRITYLVLKIARGLAVAYLETLNTQKPFEYNEPPSKDDYKNFLTLAEIKDFFEYIGGKKKEIFFDDTIKNWGIRKNQELDVFIDIDESAGLFFCKPDIEYDKKMQEKAFAILGERINSDRNLRKFLNEHKRTTLRVCTMKQAEGSRFTGDSEERELLHALNFTSFILPYRSLFALTRHEDEEMFGSIGFAGCADIVFWYHHGFYHHIMKKIPKPEEFIADMLWDSIEFLRATILKDSDVINQIRKKYEKVTRKYTRTLSRQQDQLAPDAEPGEMILEIPGQPEEPIEIDDAGRRDILEFARQGRGAPSIPQVPGTMANPFSAGTTWATPFSSVTDATRSNESRFSEVDE